MILFIKKLFSPVFLSFGILLLCSCSSPNIELFTLKHSISINSDGSPYACNIFSNKHLIIPATEYNYTNHIETIITSIKKSGKTNILIFVFGGMNSIDSTIEKSYVLANAITNTSDYYPILINWESSLFNAYCEHLFWSRRGFDNTYIGLPLAPFYFFADVGRAVTRLPINLVYQFIGIPNDLDLDLNYDLNLNLDDSLNQLNVKEDHYDSVKIYSGKDYTPVYSYLLRGIVYTCGFPARLITTPMIDACGKSAWDIMLKRTRMAFKRQPSNKVIYDKNNRQIIFSAPDGAMSILMKSLQNLYTNNHNYSFTLIGHSLGPVMLNELIRNFPNLPYKNIVYLAGACTIRDTKYALNPYMREFPNTTFYNLCLNNYADKYDMMWFAILPRGSILEWIDTFLGDLLTFDDYAIGKWNNSIRMIQSINPKYRKNIVIKAFGINDPKTNTIIIDEPQQHTDFSDPKLLFWLPNFWKIPELNNSNTNN